MRRLAWALALLASCGGEDPAGGREPKDGEGGPTCASAADCAFGERCVDGACSSEVPPPVTDEGCTTDDDCPAGSGCAVSTGLCVEVAVDPLPEPDPTDLCLEGESRPCGSKVGQCQYGTQGCVEGSWGECLGGVGPSDESCNGLDDDCDGAVPAEELDADGDGVPACAGDCAPDDGDAAPGLTELCDGKDNDCEGGADEGTDPLCDDGFLCNGFEACVAGACAPGAAVDCSELDGACVVGQCTEPSGACEAQPKSDGTTCDDGQQCTVGTSCDGGVCGGGTPLDCSELSGLCNDGVCVEGSGCVASPKDDDTPCEDLSYCLVGETCQTGACTGGTPRDCGGEGACMAGGTCNEGARACENGTPTNLGLPCDDGLFCWDGSVCLADGTCGDADPHDCSAVEDDCNDSVCNELLDRCLRDAKTNGTGCDDGRFCTAVDTCTGGTCGGTSRDCSGAADACNTGVCNETDDVCAPAPRADGTSCPDSLYCTVGETCLSGSCTTQPRNCNAVGNQCNNPSCNEALDTCAPTPKPNNTLCEDGQFCTASDTCQSGACTPGGPRDCSLVADECHQGVCNESANVCEPVETGTCNCNAGIDGDFDGSNQCDDCDDADGSRRPGATERCNGVDDDCDGKIDEDFDGDTDNYSECATNPLLFDCNDADPFVNPGAPERCGPSLTGNGVDDNCNGYIDEGCQPCNATDTDGDGVSQCQGDCAPSDGQRYPGNAEDCDGLDNDCNIFTIDNCDVSDTCNWPSGADVCKDDLLCACIVNNAGDCNNNSPWVCTAFCNTSVTGPLGDGCAADQTCFYDILRSANVHGCSAVDYTPGTKVGGVACGSDSECRSGSCVKLFTGPGTTQYCVDSCGSDAYCTAGGTVCRGVVGADVDGLCWPTNRLGTSVVGATCTSDSSCDHGLCANVGGTRYCSEVCCSDADCGAGYTCGLTGTTVASDRAFVESNAPACNPGTCPTGLSCVFVTSLSAYRCGWPMVETAPMCIKDVSGQGTRRAGAACTQNADCQSNFCEASLNVCVEVCCSDATCPTGLTCELQTVEAANNTATAARICVNQSIGDIVERK